MQLNGQDVYLKIWDTAGQERFRTITHSFYRQADGMFIVYDVTNRNSFNGIPGWMEGIHEHADENVIKYLVANKIDMAEGRVVTREEGQKMANQYNVKYYETSAKDNTNIKELIEDMGKEIMEKCTQRQESMRISIANSKKQAKEKKFLNI